MTEFTFDAIGTHWVIDIHENLSPVQEKNLLDQITARIKEFDKAYSRFRDDSLVMEMSRNTGRFTLPQDALPLFTIYRSMYDITGGLFTPLIGQTLVDAGYDAMYSLTQKKELVRPVTWDEAFVYTHPYIDIKIPSILDFGAAGKGYLIDIVSDLLEKNNIFSYCVDAGGDMRYRNSFGESLSVGLEHPDDTEKIIGVVYIQNESLCGSAGNRRVWNDFHHIINPDTLISPRHIKAVWVIGESTLLADALTTALFFVSPDTLSNVFNFEYCMILSDNSIEKSKGFNAEIFS